jgi:hypothetical protein
MKIWLGKGWKLTLRHKYVSILLFLYQLLWGIILFRYVDTIVTNILSRYPSLHPNNGAVTLFVIEAEFRLLRTDLPDPYLWMLGGLLLARMLVTPLFHAGLYYSFQQADATDNHRQTHVLAGIRKTWRSIALLYVGEKILILLPVLWLLPLARKQFYSALSAESWLFSMLPYAAAWLAWGLVIHLLFLGMQFGATGEVGIVKGLRQALVRSWPLLVVTLTLAGIGLAASALVSFVTIVWSGFVAVLLHQAFHLFRTLLSIWTAASQLAAWRP